MTDLTNFLATMAALSTAVQTLIDHVVKGRWTWLDTATPNDPKNEGRRQSAVHLISFLVGGGVALSVGLKPLTLLGLNQGVLAYGTIVNSLVNYVAAGVLVSFGSGFFNEGLDAVRAFKKAQEGVRQAQVSDGVALPNVTS
jgi:hypothetical protein